MRIEALRFHDDFDGIAGSILLLAALKQEIPKTLVLLHIPATARPGSKPSYRRTPRLLIFSTIPKQRVGLTTLTRHS
jgi:hypothetical protein